MPDRQLGTQQKPLQDWFSKDEFERYIVEIDEFAEDTPLNHEVMKNPSSFFEDE